MEQIPEELAQKIGDEVISIFFLKPDKNKLYYTAFGYKTPVGIGRTVVNIIECVKKGITPM